MGKISIQLSSQRAAIGKEPLLTSLSPKTIAQNWLVTVATTQMIDNLSVSNNHNLSRQRKIKMNLKEKIFIENL
jgi:hypothetical protein